MWKIEEVIKKEWGDVKEGKEEGRKKKEGG
jgi:hypothetical protein